MSLISSMNIAQQALTVNQAAITVVSNNIANVDTEGYSKQRVNMAAVINYTPSQGNEISVAESLSGVTIADVTRYADAASQAYYRQESTVYAYLDKYTSIASNVEGLVNELQDTGLAGALNNFYAAANALNNDPSDVTVRANYANTAQNVCYVFNTISDNMSNIRTSLVGDYTDSSTLPSSEIYSDVDSVNNILDQLTKVNNDIIRTNSFQSASSALLDQRDVLVKQLSDLVSVNAKEQSNHTVDVSIGNYSLIRGNQLNGHLSVTSGDANNPAIVNIVDPDDSSVIIAGNVNSEIHSGDMGAIISSCGPDSPTKFTIKGILDDIDLLANNFAEVLNTIQNGDPNGDGTTAMAIDKTTKTLIVADPATDFFVSDDASNTTITAGNISVNQTILNDPYLVAAARLDLSSYTDPSQYENSIGNNSNVSLIMESRGNTVHNLDDDTFEKYLANMVATVGYNVQDLNSNFENQALVVDEVQSKTLSTTGVNLDEELIDLVKYQRAYQASARIFNVCNDLLGELVNLGK